MVRGTAVTDWRFQKAAQLVTFLNEKGSRAAPEGIGFLFVVLGDFAASVFGPCGLGRK